VENTEGAQPVLLKKTLSRANGAVNKPAWNLAKAHGDEANFTPIKVSVDQMYSAIKDQEFSEVTPVKHGGTGSRGVLRFPRWYWPSYRGLSLSP